MSTWNGQAALLRSAAPPHTRPDAPHAPRRPRSQVTFYDHSEILLSSEARVVTYVDKTGQRSTHLLRDVMRDNRPDIAKRLRYTKDILHQLITGGK